MEEGRHKSKNANEHVAVGSNYEKLRTIKYLGSV